MRVAIVDDEPAQRQALMDHVRAWAAARGCPPSLAAYGNAEAFLFALDTDRTVDVLLLDIQMPGMDGMALARRLRAGREQVQIVFVTGYEEHMAQGYDVAALHYLIKPVAQERLFAVLDRARDALNSAEATLLIEGAEGSVRLRQRDILYAEALSPMVRMQVADGAYECRMNFADFEKLLDAGRFVRCHRSYIVGLAHVRRITRTDVILEEGQAVPLARREYDAVHQAFIRYHKEGR